MCRDDNDDEEEDVDEVEGDDEDGVYDEGGDDISMSWGKRDKVNLIDERCTLHSTDPDKIAGFEGHPVPLTIGVDPGSREPATAVWCMTQNELPRDTMWEVVNKCDPSLGGVYKIARGAMTDKDGLKILVEAATTSTPDARVGLLDGFDFRYAVEESVSCETEEEEESCESEDVKMQLQTAMHNMGLLTAALFWGSVDEHGVRQRHIQGVVKRGIGSVDGFTWLRDIEVSRLYIC